MSHEVWKPVIYKGVAYETEVSNLGRLRNAKTKRIRAVVGLTRGGGSRTRYRIINLHAPGKKITVRVAVLVANAFLRPRLPGEQIEHENQVSTDDRADNLKIVASQSENVTASYKAGKRRKPKPNALTQDDYDRIFELHKQGLSQVVIGQIVGCTNSNVSRVLTGRNERPKIRRTAGSCNKCSRPRLPGYTCCEVCREKRRARDERHRRRLGAKKREPVEGAKSKAQRGREKIERWREKIGEEEYQRRRALYRDRYRAKKKAEKAAQSSTGSAG